MQRRRLLLWLLPLFAVAVIAVSRMATTVGGEGSVQPGSTQPAPAAVVGTDLGTVTVAAPAPATIVLRGGRLTVSLESVPLHQVASEVSRLSGINIHFQGRHRTLLLNQQFEDYPLEQGLRTLLREADSLFVYNEAGLLSSVVLLPDGEDAGGNIENVEATGIDVALKFALEQPVERQLQSTGVHLVEQLTQSGLVGSADVFNEQMAPEPVVQLGERLAHQLRHQLAGELQKK